MLKVNRYLQNMSIKCHLVRFDQNEYYHCSSTRILTDSARKRKGKEVLANYNKTRIKIGHQHDRLDRIEESVESSNSC
jgi:hypothetical protein